MRRTELKFGWNRWAGGDWLQADSFGHGRLPPLSLEVSVLCCIFKKRARVSYTGAEFSFIPHRKSGETGEKPEFIFKNRTAVK